MVIFFPEIRVTELKVETRVIRDILSLLEERGDPSIDLASAELHAAAVGPKGIGILPRLENTMVEPEVLLPIARACINMYTSTPIVQEFAIVEHPSP